MPIYEYECGSCGPFEALRPVAERNDPGMCPACGLPAMRGIFTPPRLSALAQELYRAHAVNERNAHAPQNSSGHGSRCSCCTRAAAGTKNRQAAKSFPRKRPWMISH